jgi:hypothetical protein
MLKTLRTHLRHWLLHILLVAGLSVAVPAGAQTVTGLTVASGAGASQQAASDKQGWRFPFRISDAFDRIGHSTSFIGRFQARRAARGVNSAAMNGLAAGIGRGDFHGFDGVSRRADVPKILRYGFASGQSFGVVVSAQDGLNFVMGSSLSDTGDGVGFSSKDTRGGDVQDVRAGLHWNGGNESAFYGVTMRRNPGDLLPSGGFEGVWRMEFRF